MACTSLKHAYQKGKERLVLTVILLGMFSGHAFGGTIDIVVNSNTAGAGTVTSSPSPVKNNDPYTITMTGNTVGSITYGVSSASVRIGTTTTDDAYLHGHEPHIQRLPSFLLLQRDSSK